MHMPWKKESQTRNEIAIDEVYNFLEQHKSAPNSDEYHAALESLKVLTELQKQKQAEPLNMNTVITVSSYVFVAGGVLIFEIFGHSITSKVMSVALPKPRI